MIIASKGTVRMKGDTADVVSEFITIAIAIMKEAEMSKDMLNLALDMAELVMSDGHLNKTS